MKDNSKYKVPPVTIKDDGSERLAGFELEFSGLSLEQTVEAIQSSLGGTLVDETIAEKVVHVESLGDFTIELDWAFLKKKAEQDKEKNENNEWLEPLSKAASAVVPVEVVCPPVPVTQIESLNPLVVALRDAGAVGTEESLLAAYGVHINTEIPKLDEKTLYSYLCAYSLLQCWLVEAHDVDISRKISPYIGLYPEGYVKDLLLNSGCSIEELCINYLEHNATRNRALDMLPIFARVDEDRIKKEVGDDKVNARPAFHYRLPNCDIEQTEWSLHKPWNNWCLIEELAHREEELDKLGEAFLAADKPLIGVIRSNWVEYLDQWLRDHGLV